MIKKPVIFGISGTKLTAEERRFFSENHVLGFILFKRNLESKEQIKELIDDLRSLQPNRQVTVWVDQEGGRVARIRPPVGLREYPPIKDFGDMYAKDEEKALKAIEENYFMLMQELKEFGFDSPCAPVCDLFFPDAHKIVMGDRCFSDNVNVLVNLARSAIEGIKKAGGVPIIKHIPGHGRAKLDSHYDLPIVSESLEELNKNDFEVFRQLAKDSSLAMTAHIIYECIDKTQPATLSAKVIDFIRNEIGFKGQIVSDDLNMKALHHGIDCDNKMVFLPSLANVAKAAYEAGCDIILHCSGNFDEIKAVYDAIPAIEEEQVKI